MVLLRLPGYISYLRSFDTPITMPYLSTATTSVPFTSPPILFSISARNMLISTYTLFGNLSPLVRFRSSMFL